MTHNSINVVHEFITKRTITSILHSINNNADFQTFYELHNPFLYIPKFDSEKKKSRIEQIYKPILAIRLLLGLVFSSLVIVANTTILQNWLMDHNSKFWILSNSNTSKLSCHSVFYSLLNFLTNLSHTGK